MDKYANNNFKKSLKNWLMARKKPIPCFASSTTIYFDCYGNIRKCLKKGPILSLINKDPLKIWKGINLIREEVRLCAECHTDCQAIPDLLLSKGLDDI